MAVITLQIISDQINPEGWKVVSTEYKNLKTEMEFKCPEGHSVFTTWGHLRDHLECPVCNLNKAQKIFKTDNSIPKKGKAFRVLALDQATHKTGYAIFDDKELIDSGVFVTREGDEVDRYQQVKQWLISMIHAYDIDYVGFEGIQYQQNQQMGVTTFETLAELKGVLKETVYELGVQYRVCPTNTWRHAVGVKGRTRNEKKSSMQMLVKKWFDVTVDDDRADAIGIGKYLSENIVAKPKIVFGEE